MEATWILTAIIDIYFFIAACRIAFPLVRLKRASGRVSELPGAVIGYKGREYMPPPFLHRHSDEKIEIAYPVYSLQIYGENKEVTAHTKMLLAERKLHQKVTMLYDEKTGGIWCKDDLKEMKSTVKMQLIVIALLMIVVALTGLLP